MNRRKVAIVVKGSTHVHAPWGDSGWEIWGLPWMSYPRVDRFIEIHEQQCVDTCTPPEEDAYHRNFGEAKTKWAHVPTYCVASRAHFFPNPKPYPMKEILEELPVVFLEDSVSHMIALAIHEKVDELGLYGVHMRGAYASHRPSVTYLVGLAQGRGMTVTVPPGSPLFMSEYVMGRYGITNERRF